MQTVKIFVSPVSSGVLFCVLLLDVGRYKLYIFFLLLFCSLSCVAVRENREIVLLCAVTGTYG